MNKIFECEICIEKFPIDCFEFMPCMHKMCSFCFNSLSKTECPFCKTSIINLNYETVENEIPENYELEEREKEYDKEYYKSYNLINEKKNENKNKKKIKRKIKK
jgi:hypothetical protein